LQFFDSENDLIDVESSNDLQEACLFYSNHKGEKLLKFLISLK
jgi:hypothetical protein